MRLIALPAFRHDVAVGIFETFLDRLHTRRFISLGLGAPNARENARAGIIHGHAPSTSLGTSSLAAPAYRDTGSSHGPAADSSPCPCPRSSHEGSVPPSLRPTDRAS